MTNHGPSVRRIRDELFWTLTDRSGPTGCWEWTARRQTKSKAGKGGYGTVQRHNRRIFAHRHAYELAIGPIPAGMEVLHSCDNPPCINPAHLRLGTHADNMADAAAKGRTARPAGSRHPRTRLTEDDVATIRALRRHGADSRIVAALYGISRESFYAITNGRSWSHVQPTAW